MNEHGLCMEEAVLEAALNSTRALGLIDYDADARARTLSLRVPTCYQKNVCLLL